MDEGDRLKPQDERKKPMQPQTERHTGNPVSTHVLMHADEIIAVAHRESNSVDVKLPEKLPFGLRTASLDYVDFMRWLDRRTDNLQRTYMNKVYIARKVGRELNNILRDSCALSVTDQFWINRSDMPDMTWSKLQEKRDQNETLVNVALTGNTAYLDWEAALQGTTSLFALKGQFPKAIRGNVLLKRGGTQEREWVASVIGEALNLPVQKAVILSPAEPSGKDDALVSIELFTNENNSLVHASELFSNAPDYSESCAVGQQHRYFYDQLPNDALKYEFERVLILNWLISNHDMHGENFGCLYDPNTFEIKNITPSFDHNSADFDGTTPDFDVPGIVIPSLARHNDVIEKIKSGELETAVNSIGDWLTDEQKNGIKTVGQELLDEYERGRNQSASVKLPAADTNAKNGTSENRYFNPPNLTLPSSSISEESLELGG
ncbi:hypothetical protein FACS1894188_06680 [Clostridia bacterium]|nr:hypothetical protein FACS1894188_06680 [Clostridia bacterium]